GRGAAWAATEREATRGTAGWTTAAKAAGTAASLAAYAPSAAAAIGATATPGALEHAAHQRLLLGRELLAAAALRHERAHLVGVDSRRKRDFSAVQRQHVLATGGLRRRFAFGPDLLAQDVLV